MGRRRASRGHDLISQLLRLEDSGALDEDLLVAQCAMLFFAGHETTRNLLGNGLFTFLQHPEQWQKLHQTLGEFCLMATCVSAAASLCLLSKQVSRPVSKLRVGQRYGNPSPEPAEEVLPWAPRSSLSRSRPTEALVFA